MNLQEKVARWRKRLSPKHTSPITHLVPRNTGESLCELPAVLSMDFHGIDISLPNGAGDGGCYVAPKPTKPICPDCKAVLTELLRAPDRPSVADVCRKTPPCADGPGIPCLACIDHEEGVA